MALTDFYSKFELIKEFIEPDELGTHTETYKIVLEFYGAVTTTGSSYSERAEQPAPDTACTLTTSKSVPIKFNDIIHDTEKNIFYQVASDGMQTPKSAGLDIRQFAVRKIKINMI